MAHYSEAKGSGSGRKLHHLEVSRGKKGFSVAHHFEQGSAQSYRPPEEHNFGETEGKQMMAHIGGAMGVGQAAEPQEEEEQDV